MVAHLNVPICQMQIFHVQIYQIPNLSFVIYNWQISWIVHSKELISLDQVIISFFGILPYLDLRKSKYNIESFRGSVLVKVNMSEENWSGQNASELDLSGANLTGANLSAANMESKLLPFLEILIQI